MGNPDITTKEKKEKKIEKRGYPNSSRQIVYVQQL
jgi:hypothetical protein